MSSTRMHIVDESLSEAERRLARVIDSTAPGVWDWDLSTNEFRATPRLRAILGVGHKDALNMDVLLKITHSADRGWIGRLGETVPVDSEPRLLKFRILKADTGDTRWIATRVWTEYELRDGQKVAKSCSASVVDITDEVTTASALVESEERLRLAIEAGKMAVWEVDLETGTMTQSPELNTLCGLPRDMNVRLSDVRALYNPGEIERIAKEKNTVEAVRERAVGGAFEPRRPGVRSDSSDRTQVQAEVAITTPAGVPKRLMLRAQYAVSQEGRPRLTGLLMDITETKMAEERIAVVARELQHRVRNLISVVGSIASQTLRGMVDSATELSSFRGRLDALAAANELILARSSSATELRSLIETIIRPYVTDVSGRFVLDGPPVHLVPEAATPLGMVLHELCTNAVKYGSLSVAGGEVRIRWSRNGENHLVIAWHECNGPVVTPPGRRGFGSRLIQSVLSGQLRGTVTHDFKPDGIYCEIKLDPLAAPISQIVR